MTIIEALTDLQEVDGRIRELEAELKDLPRRKAHETARLTGVSTDLDAAKAGLDEAERRVGTLEDEKKTLGDKLQKLKIDQATLKSNKEYTQYAFQQQLIEKDIESTDNTITAAQDDIEASKVRVRQAQERFDQEAGVVKTYCDEIDERIAAVTAELAEAQKERSEKARLVTDPKAMLYYERLRTKRWPVVVPLTHEGVCDGCHLVQPPSVSQMVDANARRGEEGAPQVIVACTMCGRMLYR
ncbi:MAG: hypothetical protein IJ829_07190 [Kiritimatiellae bacterium]|nr:hypothetical protein [Kiritimatiellia bacterium]